MSKQIELVVKINGSTADLDKMVASLRGLGAEAGKTKTPLGDTEKGLKGLKDSGDSAEKTIAGLEKRLADLGKNPEATKRIQELREKINSLGKESNPFEGFNERIRASLESPLSVASTNISSLFEKIGPGGAITAGAVAGLGIIAHKAFELVDEFGAAAQATQNFATKLGVTADQAAKLQAAGKIVGVQAESLIASSRYIAIALEDEAGAGKKVSDSLKKLGIDTIDLKGRQREMGDVLLDTLEKLSHIESTSQRVAIAQSILGRGAREILPLIQNYAELQQVVARMGTAFDEGDEALLKAKQNINELDGAWEELKKHLAVKLTPNITFVIKGLTSELESGHAGRDALNGALSLSGPLGFVLGKGRSLAANLNDANTASVPRLNTTLDPTGSNAFKQILAGQAGEFNSKYGAPTREDQEKQLETLKKTRDEMKAVLSKGGVPEGSDSFKEGQSKFADVTTKIKQLEDALKKAKDLTNLLKQLADEEAKVNARINFAIGDTNYSLQLGPQAEKVREIKQRDEELLKELGPAYATRITTLFANQQLETIANAVQKNRDQIINEVKKVDEEAAKKLDFQSKEFDEALRKRISETGKSLQNDERLLKLFYGSEDRKLTQSGNEQVRAIELDPRKNDQQKLNEQYAVRLGIAKKIFENETDRANEALASAQTQDEKEKASYDLAAAKAKLEEESDKARIEQQEKVLDLQRKQYDQARGAAGSLYEALRGGPQGLAGLTRGFADSQTKIIFENATQGLFKAAAGTLGQVGAKTGNLGGLLNGTVFDGKNAGGPQEKNTKALDRASDSVDALTSAITGKPVGNGLSVPGLGSALSIPGLGRNPVTTPPFIGDTYGDDNGDPFSFSTTATAGKSSGVLSQFFTGLKSVLPTKDANGNYQGGLFSGIFNPNGESTSARIGNVVGSIGATAAAAGGIISGIQQGGARGALGATSSALGLAAAIPGPQQPFVAAVAVITGLVKGLLGDPKAERQGQLTRELTAAQIAAKSLPGNIGVQIDSSGAETDRDYKGNVRLLNNAPKIESYNNITGVNTVPGGFTLGSLFGQPSTESQLVSNTAFRTSLAGQPIQVVNVNVNAIDSKSFNDHADSIASAVVTAFNRGHRIRQDINTLVRPR